jgi:starvation-inducible DNA-binding protein
VEKETVKTLRTSDIFDDKTTAQIADQLQPTLTDLIALGLLTKQAHWNVQGPHFRAIHLHLDEIYASVQEHVDTVAERIATLGVAPSGQAKEVSADTVLSQFPLGFLKDVQVIDLMTDRIGNTCRVIRERMAEIEDVDTVTADMLHQVLDSLEKHLWMMRSQGM